MTEQKIQVGDKVRITYEGVVTDVNKYNEPMIDGGQYFYTDVSRPLGEKYQAGKVEILEKRKPQVGDVIASRRKFVNLPEGSVVTNGDGDAMIVRHGRTYAPGLTSPAVLMPGLRFADFSLGCTPYTVIYIPSA